ncbi:MAG TPA: hypothetical protein PLD25_32355 [Chloroflexota bacterium]|nr:hypothetical protein [Chloroflexota bacterium]HUM69086.1 hypothetical protein [Chloroflexota bacterium]
MPARSGSYWPYPLPAAEMIARYGLRYLTPEEKRVFPGLPLVLDVFKARLIKPPAAVPMARPDWVVWVAETYPGCYLVRLPGGAPLPAPYNEMSWTVVAHDVPATTLTTALEAERQRQWRTAVRRRIRQNLQLQEDSPERVREEICRVQTGTA